MRFVGHRIMVPDRVGVVASAGSNGREMVIRYRQFPPFGTVCLTFDDGFAIFGFRIPWREEPVYESEGAIRRWTGTVHRMNGRLAGTSSEFGPNERAVFSCRQRAGSAAMQEENDLMARDSIAGLIAQLYTHQDRSSRVRKAGRRAGLSAALVGQVLDVHATRAQDEMPPATTIGEAGYVHSTDTSKGTIKIYSSWPLTGSMEGVGGDAVQAAKMAFDDFGNAAGRVCDRIRSPRRRRCGKQRWLGSR